PPRSTLFPYTTLFRSQHPPVATGTEMQLVKNVGAKISMAVEQYMRKNGNAKRVEGYKWEFNLVNDKQVNAWCMPGGKVVVYTGLDRKSTRLNSSHDQI